jgi:hypothetical protein
MDFHIYFTSTVGLKSCSVFCTLYQPYFLPYLHHGLINFIDTKAKCCHLKKFTCKGTLRQVYLSEAPSLLGFCLGYSNNFVGSESGHILNVKLLQNLVSNRTPYPPCTLYTYIQYTNSTGKGGGGN